ncbi:uncharacterized protein LOC118192478 [Stegodyphus dumicola]|uniref:uncharacterized protein LOC118192478 n=1 Tax=Stegodyphus dumicola TaxID=202533 RepID=UPI0015B31240|nr:uncharacterized protein LOC118192478 [Stegodyphus dumicola]
MKSLHILTQRQMLFKNQISLLINMFKIAMYSTVFGLHCRADKNPEFQLVEDNDDFVHIYKEEKANTWTPVVPKTSDRSATIWIAVVSVVASVFLLLTCCVLIYKFFLKKMFSGQASNAGMVYPPPVVVYNPRVMREYHGNQWTRFHDRQTEHYAMASTNNSSPLNDVPPDYSAISKTSSTDSASRYAHYPQVFNSKKLETPPPEYITVAPFK